MDLNSSNLGFTVVCCITSLRFAGENGARCRRVSQAEHRWSKRHRQVQDLGKNQEEDTQETLLCHGRVKKTGSLRKKGFGSTGLQWTTLNIHSSSLTFQENKRHLVQGGSQDTHSPRSPFIAITETSQHLITHKPTIVMCKSITNVKFPAIAGNLLGEIHSDPLHAPKSSPI